MLLRLLLSIFCVGCLLPSGVAATSNSDPHGGHRINRRAHERILQAQRERDVDVSVNAPAALEERANRKKTVSTTITKKFTSTSFVKTVSATETLNPTTTVPIRVYATATTTVRSTEQTTQVQTINKVDTTRVTATSTRGPKTTVTGGATSTVTVTVGSKGKRDDEEEEVDHDWEKRTLEKRATVTSVKRFTKSTTLSKAGTTTVFVATETTPVTIYQRTTRTALTTKTVVTSATVTSTSTNRDVSTIQTTTTTTGGTMTVTQAPTSYTTVCPPVTSGTGSCAASYTACSALGHVPTIYGTGTLPKPSTFVTRNPSTGKLYSDGKQYNIAGPNIYWLGIGDDASNSSNVIVPSHQRIREAMAIAVAMGANTIRSISLGVSTGHPYTLEPSAGQFNEDAWESIDYAVYAAKQYGLRLVIPLTDSYKYYHGGMYNFVDFAGLDGNAPNYRQIFFTDRTVINLFKQYIRYYLNHTNQYTGIVNSEEPTIMIWETGNELGAYMLQGGAPPAAWTDEISTLIKSIAPSQLVMDGTNGLFDANGKFQATGYNLDNVDILTNHYYPPGGYLLKKDAPIAVHNEKAYLVGEYDWTDLNNPSTPIADLLPMLESSTAAGDMIWSVYGHDDDCCNFVQHNDGFTLYYPNGNDASLQANILLTVQHWYRQTGRNVPVALPAVVCKQPTF